MTVHHYNSHGTGPHNFTLSIKVSLCAFGSSITPAG